MDKRRVNVRAIIWNNGKLLAVKHKSKHGGESNYWALPGGGLDPFESLTDGLTRELVEETGVPPQIGRILFGQQLRSARAGRDEELEFIFHITNPGDYQSVDLTQTSHGAIELTRCEFITPSSEAVLPQFLRTIDIQSYIDEIKPVDIINNLTETTV